MSALFRIGYGLYVVTSNDGKRDNGLIVNSVTQLTDNPYRVAVNINKANYSHHVIQQTGVLNVNCLSVEAPFSVFERFGFQSGREVDKFADYTAYQNAENGVPYITEGTNAYLAVKVSQTVDLGSHTMFIGEVTEMEVLSEEPSANYEYYQEEVKPKPEEVGKTADGQTVWRCTICGYEYVGEELPEDFICPLCKHPASDFEKVIKN